MCAVSDTAFQLKRKNLVNMQKQKPNFQPSFSPQTLHFEEQRNKINPPPSPTEKKNKLGKK